MSSITGTTTRSQRVLNLISFHPHGWVQARGPVLLAVLVVGAWVAAVVLAIVGLPSTGSWERIIVTAAGAGSVALVLWPRTTHPSDAWDQGVEEGRLIEREDHRLAAEAERLRSGSVPRQRATSTRLSLLTPRDAR